MALTPREKLAVEQQILDLEKDKLKIRQKLADFNAAELEHARTAAGLDQSMRTLAEEQLALRLERRDVAEGHFDQMTKNHAAERSWWREEERNIQNKLDGYDKEIEMAKAKAQYDVEASENLATELERLEEKKRLLEESTKAAEALAGTTASAFKTEHSTNFVASLKEVTAAFQTTEGVRLFAQKAMVGITEMMIDNTIGLAIALYDSENAFMRATGAGERFAGTMSSVYISTRGAGVTIQESAAAMEKLHGTYTDFTMLNSATQAELARTGVILQKLGVSNDVYAQSIQNVTKAMGISAGQADDTMRELVAHAKDLGVAPQKLSQDFAAAGGTLAKFGTQGVKAFKDLAHTSKITGIEVGRLLDITSKFDTFEGAAEQAGKLNAALGGNFVNAMDLMMETDPNERFKMLRESILDAGLSFDDMSYYQKQFYTESLGLKDVGELAAALSGDMNNLGGDMNKTSADFEAMRKEAEKTQSLQEQWKSLLAELTPALTTLVGWLRKLIAEKETFLPIMKNMLIVFAAYTAIVKLSAIAMGLKAIAMIAITWQFWALAAAVAAVYYWFYKKRSSPTFFEGLWEMRYRILAIGLATGLLALAFGLAGKGALKFGAGMLLAGAGIWVAAKGLEAFVSAFEKMSPAAINAITKVILALTLAFGAFVAALFYLASDMMMAKGVQWILNSLAAAAVGVGVGLLAAAAALAIFVFLIPRLVKGLEILRPHFAEIATYIAGLIGLFREIQAPMTTLRSTSLAFGAVLLIMYLVLDDLLIVFNAFADSFTNMVQNTVDGIGTIAEEFASIATTIDNLPAENTMKLTALMAATSLASTATAAVAGPAAAASAVVGKITGEASAAGGGGQAVSIQLDAAATKAFLTGQVIRTIASHNKNR